MTKKLKRLSPTELPLQYEIDPEPCEESITARGGMSLVVEAFRGFGLPGSIKRHVHTKQRQRGYDEGTLVESFLILNAAGGDCIDDFDSLREDDGLAELIGHELPSSTAARNFLYQFHDEGAIEQAQKELPMNQVAYVPGESEPLRGLAMVNRDLVQTLGQRCPDQKIVTIDLDSTLIESRKREALLTYEGYRGYQPMMAVWAETDLLSPTNSGMGMCPRLLFEDGSQVRHFAVVTNIWDWAAGRLIEWHREKAGTIEIVNDVIKNELAGGVMPCRRFGADAAWFRLAVISHNVLTGLKRVAMKPEMLNARPKRLRFLYLNVPGKVVHHARKLLLRMKAAAGRIAEFLEIIKLLQPSFG
jgi:hypothetical protein